MGLYTPRAEDILPLVAFFVGFDWELDIYIALMTLNLCDQCPMIMTSTGDSWQEHHLQMKVGWRQMDLEGVRG